MEDLCNGGCDASCRVVWGGERLAKPRCASALINEEDVGEGAANVDPGTPVCLGSMSPQICGGAERVGLAHAASVPMVNLSPPWPAGAVCGQRSTVRPEAMG